MKIKISEYNNLIFISEKINGENKKSDFNNYTTNLLCNLNIFNYNYFLFL